MTKFKRNGLGATPLILRSGADSLTPYTFFCSPIIVALVAFGAKSLTMAGGNPLFVRPSSDNFPERNIEEEDALLTGQHIDRTQAHMSPQKWREFGLFAWAMIATVAVIILAVAY